MICVSLAKLHFKECLEALNMAAYAEVRIDQLSLTSDEFSRLFAEKGKTIATCRPENLSLSEQREKLQKAIDSGAAFVDIEYEAPESYRNELVDYAHKHKTKVIISYHNFEETPSISELENIITQMLAMGAEIIKIATMSHGTKDNALIMSLYGDHSGLIAFCMGDEGKITRVAAPLLGAPFTYAAFSPELATAPGQLTVNELNEIYKVMKVPFYQTIIR